MLHIGETVLHPDGVGLATSLLSPLSLCQEEGTWKQYCLLSIAKPQHTLGIRTDAQQILHCLWGGMPSPPLHPWSAEHSHPMSSALCELPKMTHLRKNPGSKCTQGERLGSGGWVWPFYTGHSSKCG